MNTTQGLKEKITEKRDEARLEGIHPQCVFLLSPEARYAQAIYKKLHGKPMAVLPKTQDDQDPLEVEVVAPAEAARLLQRHGGKAGALLAPMLQEADEISLAFGE